ncbi:MULTISPECIES: aminoglycoside 6'-N-acetyltransferase [Aeromonas]|uniref:aminoglycoside 6'-N-acetyltransferase n=1 Tax=Aeromonas TaxID=642 RepID=UPI001F3722E7|nr:aminoglycoside 6'-N-acetyltransferase [Aeromonas veronii]MCF5894227.1 GNAT family N-acetyltransferase [Aeromonas veronii]
MTNIGWQIVPLDETLLAQWATLRQQLWPHHALSAHLQEGVEMLANAHINAFLALDEQSQAVGFADAALRHDYVNGCESSPEVYLEGIYVQPASRQRGLARALIVRVAQWGREQGCREIASDTAIDNLPSQNMHERLGFRETERVVFFKKALG